MFTTTTISRRMVVKTMLQQQQMPLQQQQRRTLLGISSVLDKQLYRAAKGVMPAISKTEQIALGCGTIGFDRDIFSGTPSLQHLIETYQPKLSKEEQEFLDVKVTKLCTLLNDHQVL